MKKNMIKPMLLIVCIINFIILIFIFLNFFTHTITTIHYGVALLFIIVNLLEIIYMFISLKKEQKMNKIIYIILLLIFQFIIMMITPAYADHNYIENTRFDFSPTPAVTPTYYNVYGICLK